MATLGIKAAFARFGVILRNPQSSVSGWSPSGALVVSLWAHHYQKSAPGTMEFSGLASRWSGIGNTEFRANVAKAHLEKLLVQLVIIKTNKIAKVEAGEEASKIDDKEFFPREDLVGEVVDFDGDKYLFRFKKA